VRLRHSLRAAFFWLPRVESPVAACRLMADGAGWAIATGGGGRFAWLNRSICLAWRVAGFVPAPGWFLWRGNVGFWVHAEVVGNQK